MPVPEKPRILPLTLFAAKQEPPPAPPKLTAPFGRLIPCETVVALESNRLETPVIGLVTEDVWHDGRLVIPAGAEVHGRAALDRTRLVDQVLGVVPRIVSGCDRGGTSALTLCAPQGLAVDQAGNLLGRHDGVIRFTVGQRKRLGLSGNDEPLFVLALDAARARVVVGPRSSLRTRNISLREVNWLADPAEARDCAVKVRSMRAPVPARVAAGEGGTASVELAEPEEAIAPGQACVFYKADRVLGGGWIAPARTALATAE